MALNLRLVSYYFYFFCLCFSSYIYIVFQLYFSKQKQFLIISVLRNNNNTA